MNGMLSSSQLLQTDRPVPTSKPTGGPDGDRIFIWNSETDAFLVNCKESFQRHPKLSPADGKSQ